MDATKLHKDNLDWIAKINYLSDTEFNALINKLSTDLNSEDNFYAQEYLKALIDLIRHNRLNC